jgi:anti-sigma factor RsiW
MEYRPMTNEAETACPDQLTAITALVDEELQGEDRVSLELHLTGCTGCTAELRRQRMSKVALRRLSVSLNATPELRRRVEETISRSHPTRLQQGLITVLGVAAALLILLLAGGSWYRFTQGQPSAAELTRAVLTHQRVTNGPRPVTVESSDPARVAAWALSTTGNAIDVPAASVDGFTLAGARTASDVAAGSVTLVYQADGRRVSCTIVPLARLGPLAPPSTTPTKVTDVGGSNVVAWRDDTAVYILAGDLDSKTLLHLAQRIALSD